MCVFVAELSCSVSSVSTYDLVPRFVWLALCVITSVFYPHDMCAGWLGRP